MGIQRAEELTVERKQVEAPVRAALLLLTGNPGTSAFEAEP